MALLGANGQPITTARPQPGPAKTPEEPAAPTRVTTAFIVFQNPSGQWIATDDLGAAIVAARPPVPDDLISGCENVKAQVIAQKGAQLTASLTVQTQVAFSRQQQAAMPTPEEQALAASLMSGRR